MYKRTAYYGIMISFAMILSYVESLIPIYLGAPGIKLGLANAIIVFMLYTQHEKEALLINIIRILIVGILFGNLFSILYSIIGGFFSFICMYLAKHFLSFHLITISIIGGITHNLGQLFVALILLQAVGLLYYLPVLILGGMLTGLLIGIVVHEILLRIPGNGEWI